MLRRAYEAFNRGDLEAFMALTDDDLVARDAPELPGAQEHHGRAALARQLEDFRQTFDELAVEVREVIPAGSEKIVVIFHATGRGRGSSLPLDAELGHVLTIRRGRVAVLDAYVSREAALEAAGVSPV